MIKTKQHLGTQDTAQQIGAIKDFANRSYSMYIYYDLFVKARKSRKRKEYIKKIFNAWYGCPNPDGEYDEMFFGYPVDFANTKTFTKFFLDNSKILSSNQFGKFMKVLEQITIKTMNKL